MDREEAPLLQRLHATLTPDERSILREIVDAACAYGAAAYLVGGGVRDLLLGCSALDLDITIEGDAPAVARAAARRAGLDAPRVHEAFGTATLRFGARVIDVITARRESYSTPGALPTVTPSTLADDLARRDFTINAMALALTGPNAGGLVDPHGGAADLRRRLLRILHARSFEDDATRLLRAARYLARFRLRFDPVTAATAADDRLFLRTISPARIRHEFERIFSEHEPARALAVVQRMELPDVLVLGLRYTRRVLAAYRQLVMPADLTPPAPLPSQGRGATRSAAAGLGTPFPASEGRRGVRSEGPGEGAVAQWLLPIIEWNEAAIATYAVRFDLTHRERRAAAALPATRRALTRLVRNRSPRSVVVATLERLPAACLTAWACYSPDSGQGRLASEYLERLRHVQPLLTSNDLLAFGVPQGSLFGEVLRRLRSARLDDPSLTLDAERALVQHVLDEDRGA